MEAQCCFFLFLISLSWLCTWHVLHMSVFLPSLRYSSDGTTMTEVDILQFKDWRFDPKPFQVFLGTLSHILTLLCSLLCDCATEKKGHMHRIGALYE